MSIHFKRDFNTYLVQKLLNTSTWEIEVFLNDSSESDIWFLVINQWIPALEEYIFYHRRVGTSVFVYWINRSNPVEHAVNSQVLWMDITDSLNYFSGLINQQFFIYKKSEQNVIITWGKIYDEWQVITVADWDSEWHLAANYTNYLYIDEWAIVATHIEDNTKYLIWEIDIELTWDISAIRPYRLHSLRWVVWETWPQWPIWPQGEVWPQGIQWVKWDQWDQGIQGIQWETWPQWIQGIQGEQWPQGIQGIQGEIWASWTLQYNVSLYPTNTLDATWYYKMVTSIDDPIYNTIAVDIPTWEITWNWQLVGAVISEPWLAIWNLWIIEVPTIWNIAKIWGNSQQYAEFYFEIYQRKSDWTEVLIWTSSTTWAVNPTNWSYYEFSAEAIVNNWEFVETDRIVIKYYANMLGNVWSYYQFQFGWVDPVRTIIALPITWDVLTADRVWYSNTISWMTATDVQEAVDELDNRIDNLSPNFDGWVY